MNMLSPMHGEKLFNADIETGKVINEWGFQKDGVDVAMKVNLPSSSGPSIVGYQGNVRYGIMQREGPAIQS